MLKPYRNNKRAWYEVKDKKAGHIRRTTVLPTSTNTSIFKALFHQGTVGVDLLADQEADANFILRQLLMQIEKSQSDITENPLSTNQVYRDVTEIYF